MRFSVSRTHVKHELERGQIGAGRAVHELRNDCFTLGDLAASAVLGDNDTFVQRLAEQGREILGAGRPAHASDFLNRTHSHQNLDP
jgi:hypothetical protein